MILRTASSLIASILLASTSTIAQQVYQSKSPTAEHQAQCIQQGFPFPSQELTACIARMNEAYFNPGRVLRTGQGSGTMRPAQSPANNPMSEFIQKCSSLGFQEQTVEHAQCAMGLFQGKQQAEADQRLYQMQLRQRQYEEERAAELRAAERRRQRPSIGDILQRFGTGMAQSQSSSLAGALADGNAALLGMPLSHQNADGIPTPRPVRPRTVTITTPNGGIVTCTYNRMGNMVNCM